MLIVNAEIHSFKYGIINLGYVKISDGKIIKIGFMSEYKISNYMIDDKEVIDLCGKKLYAGFIDAHTHIGMFENGLTFEGDDGNEETDPCTPHLRAIDAINPMDKCFSEALDAGVTSVITGPGSANAIGGQLAAIKTMGRRIDNMIIKEPVAIKFALGENPKSVYHDKGETPITRMATTAIIREALHKAKRYLEEKEKFETNSEDFDEPEYDIKNEALIPLLKKEIPAHFHAHRADDIFTAIRIAKEFDLDYVIVHCTEGHLIADELAKENAKILSGPILCDRSKPELVNLNPSSTGIISKNGLKPALVTDHPVIPIQYLPLCAALAVREGLNEEEAIRAITVYPAQICGIDNRVGDIAEGLDADLCVFDKSPLDFTQKPGMVFCNGKKIRG